MRIVEHCRLYNGNTWSRNWKSIDDHRDHDRYGPPWSRYMWTTVIESHLNHRGSMSNLDHRGSSQIWTTADRVRFGPPRDRVRFGLPGSSQIWTTVIESWFGHTVALEHQICTTVLARDQKNWTTVIKSDLYLPWSSYRFGPPGSSQIWTTVIESDLDHRLRVRFWPPWNESWFGPFCRDRVRSGPPWSSQIWTTVIESELDHRDNDSKCYHVVWISMIEIYIYKDHRDRYRSPRSK